MWGKIDTEFAGLLTEFEAYLKNQLPQKGGNINEIAHSVIASGGKRLRPAFALLFFSMNSGEAALPSGDSREKIFSAAAAIELLHTATLIHDDIIDGADTRRGRPTVSQQYGTNIAVYTGDYLLVKSLSLLAKSGLDAEYLNEIAKGLSAICTGEVDQYFQKYHLVSTISYLKRITRKTALLFSAAAAVGAKLADLPEDAVKNAAKFGLYFGTAFQIRDDLIDLKSTEKAAGKPVLRDLKDGIATLPLIVAARNNKSIQDAISAFFISRDETLASEIVGWAIQSGGASLSEELLQKYVAKAQKKLTLLPDGNGRRIVQALMSSMYSSPITSL